MPAATASNQTALRRLAGALGVLCLVLFLLAIEQRHTVAAWAALREGVGQLRARALDEPPPLPAAPAPNHIVLTGEYAPADEAARTATGALTFTGAQLRFESGESLRTRPLRIALAGEPWAAGHSYAGHLLLPQDSQVELREVTASTADRLCDGAPVNAAALLHLGPTVTLMLFRGQPESHASSDILCGVWSYSAR
ncbi:hypothetical protein [Brevundimonas sp. Root1279]|uniref:hypothetical protein n=1 Tax=Brevundimonas sp. Root1279 TaxID=1736443 RepID=UPI0006FE3C2F|nr:hypothetical protein [Brevundimonas sp. Root1279]KQW81841.1 hypothetical protein ASC65_11165 [Brevundimonas sp. Root1279]